MSCSLPTQDDDVWQTIDAIEDRLWAECSIPEPRTLAAPTARTRDSDAHYTQPIERAGACRAGNHWRATPRRSSILSSAIYESSFEGHVEDAGKSRVTYSVITKRLNPDDLREFLLRELDRAGLGHNTLTDPAIDLIVRSADGVLRKARNLCVGCLIEAVRSGNKAIDIDNVNRVLRQPHWQKESDLTDF
jgi:hypothetical protein